MTEPTDVGPSTADQLFRLIRSFGYTTHGQTAEIVDAIVAKWGTPPAVAGEPVAWLDPWTGAKVTTDYDAYGKHGIPLYTAPQPTPPAVVEPLTADGMTEPKNGQQWRVEWWNESCRMMLPKDSRLDSFQSYKNGTLMFTIKKGGSNA